MQKFIIADIPPQPKKSSLQKKVERLIIKCEKLGYEFSDLELSVFEALGRVNWDEDRVNWLVLEQFERLYMRIYTKQ